MEINDKFISALNRTIELAGTSIKIRYYTPTIGSVYDDEYTLSQVGSDVWISGVVFPLNNRQGSTESTLMQQGKLIDSDKKIYVNGSIAFTGSTHLVDIQLGSPTGELFTTIEDGGITYETNGIPIYKKQFIRRLTGSIV